jgi:tRNA threonylcarbamoyladenosine biosynthesis protein TsaB
LAYILHIESTSTVCSVALSQNDQLLAIKELNNGYTHAENLHLFIQDVLLDAGIEVKQLSAISISTGPGSYTGLRIGYATAKGLAYALNIPLITVSTLQALTSLAVQQTSADALYCPMLDARRMEVYCAMYNHTLEEVVPVNALILSEESIISFKKEKPIYFFGDGMPKAKELLNTLPSVFYIENMVATAKALIPLAYQKFIQQNFDDIAYAEPMYLKEFYFATPKK